MTAQKKAKHIVGERDKARLNRTKALFVAKGTTLNAFCKESGIDQGNASKAILGTWSGVAGKALRKRIIDAAKAKPTQEAMK